MCKLFVSKILNKVEQALWDAVEHNMYMLTFLGNL